MAFFPQICELTSRAKHYGLGTQICSNGFWAKNPQRAHDYLVELIDRGLEYLLLSTDQFHIRYVPVESVINAANAAAQLGLDCQIAIPSMARDFQALSLLAKLQAETDVTVFSHPVHPIGRGENLPLRTLQWKPPQMQGCDLLGHIEVDFNGSVSCCPPSADYGNANQLVLGNVKDLPLRTILYRFQRTPLYWVIANHGPLGLYYLLQSAGIQSGIEQPNKCHECHLCRKLTNLAQAYPLFHEYTGFDLTQPLDDDEDWQCCTGYLESVIPHYGARSYDQAVSL